MRTATFGASNSANASAQLKAGATTSADLVALLQQSIQNLNSKFDKFNETVTGKIESIERNYDDLSHKIDHLANRK